jgi:hypothetical protein
MILSACVMLLLHASPNGPMAETWPYAVNALADGTWEYHYDLTGIKKQNFPESIETNGIEKVNAFLAKLPNETVVRVHPVSVDVASFEGHDAAPLATSFSTVSNSRLQSANPLAKLPGARLRVSFHPDEPKVLFSVDAAMSVVRGLEEGVVAQAFHDNEKAAKKLFEQLATQVWAKFKNAQGDEREGALALAVRLGLANSCGNPSVASPAFKEIPEVDALWKAQSARFAVPRVAAAPFNFSAALKCARFRDEVLSAPFDEGRAGTVAVLLFLEFMKEPAFKAPFESQATLRRDFLGEPAESSLPLWTNLASQIERPIENLDQFFAGLPVQHRIPPGLMPLPESPIEKYLRGLGNGAESASAFEEAAAAIVDKRFTVAPAQAPSWPQARDLALAAVVQSEAETNVHFDSPARNRFVSTFALAQGAHVTAKANELPSPEQSALPTELKIRLNVPPTLEVEPFPTAYAALAQSVTKLKSVLAFRKLQSIATLSPLGKSTAGAMATLTRWESILLGLSLLSQPKLPNRDSKETKAALSFLANWRKDAALKQDERRVVSTTAFEAPRFSVVLGVTRLAFRVSFESAPRAEVPNVDFFELDTQAAQHYLVPTRFTMDGTNNASALGVKDVKTIFESVGGDPSKIEAAFINALTP